ncbi:YiiX/YebB-like N1pC/P60 family cysteine hydrolase [Chitinilyticum litopenaei]|uniref:YiiX/YebB-like N1pC/P60 family cysteine hydrolase n=1 Tax=Chitinilyticum litopenaei TaxID=1121276 RepID=UPI0004152F95|nr:YiiX/YebB-like N1pC/P60 family cysteine hydrolase [Chitinilyticum litopenaei]
MLRAVLFALSCLVPLAALAAPDPARFQQQVGELIELRSSAYRLAQESGIIGNPKPKLTRAQSNQLRDMAQRYIDLRAGLLPNATRMAPYFEPGARLTLVGDRPTLEESRAFTMSSSRGALQRQVWINPRDAQGRQLLLDIQYGLTTALVLMDSYQIAVEPYARNPSTAYVLNYDVGNATRLRELADNYHSTGFRYQLSNATRFVDDYMGWLRANQLTPSAEESHLYALAQSTVWYVSLHQKKGSDLGEKLNYLARDLEIRNRSISDTLSHGVSMGFGNMVGLVQTRKGKLAQLSAQQQAALAGELKPLDILLEKTPFRLTDKMIPGHYGHVAVWLGSEEELRALGVWERIAPHYQQQIRKGGRIVEALRGGVTISTLEHFLNIDDLLVLRDRRTLSPQYRRDAVLTALEQVGKEYDFNFDVMTHERIVCSELAYVVFPDIAWPLDRTLGRYTISPDNVAQLAVSNQPVFDPVIVYRDGKRLDSQLRETLQALLSREKPPGLLSGVFGETARR